MTSAITAGTPDSLRASLYDFTDGREFRSGIDRLGYVFSDLEIEDALRSLELRAADEAEAAELRELGNWFFLLSFETFVIGTKERVIQRIF